MPAARQNQEKLSFEHVWALFKESDKKFQEMTMDSDKKFKEMTMDSDRKFKEMTMESDKQLKELRAEIARMEKQANKRHRELETLFTGQWGKLVESLVEGRLLALLRGFGFAVTQTFQNATDENKLMEFDIIADDTTESIVVEVKTTLKIDDINYFLEKLGRFKEVFRTFGSKTVFGAVAFLKAENNVRQYAEKMGLIVIKATGNGTILNQKDFKPKGW